MVVKIAGHKNAHRRRQRTTRISSFIDVCNELSCRRPDLTGDLPEPKIKRVFKPQRRGPSINGYFPRLYPLACHRGRLWFWNSAARGSRAGSVFNKSLDDVRATTWKGDLLNAPDSITPMISASDTATQNMFKAIIPYIDKQLPSEIELETRYLDKRKRQAVDDYPVQRK